MFSIKRYIFITMIPWNTEWRFKDGLNTKSWSLAVKIWFSIFFLFKLLYPAKATLRTARSQVSIALLWKDWLNTERFHQLTTVSCKADEINRSLLATKNESTFHHSFNVPSWTKCSSCLKYVLYYFLRCFYDFIRICNTSDYKIC